MGRNGVVWSVVAILLALSGAVVVWLLAGSEEPGSAPRAVPREADSMESRTASTEVAVGEAQVGSAPEQQSQRTAVEGAPADSLAASPAVFRGRVIDAEGAPLAGVSAKVHGWTANSERMDAYRAEHGELDWEDPPVVVTDASGRFEIAFVPPPPFQFVLDLKREGLVDMGGRWGTIEPGEVKDFGDLTMRGGVRVTGRLVDRAGAAVARPADRRFQLSINRYNRSDKPRGEIVPEDSVQAEVAADGSFTMREPVTPGFWNLSLRGPLPIERRQEVEIVAPETDFDVAVYRDEELLRVSGVVVDDSGAPVPRADFDPVGVEKASSWLQYADREGRFEFVQRPDAVDPDQSFRLRFEQAGYLTVTTDEVRWGDTALRVVMQRAPVMEVLVLRASDRSPLEEYGLRVMSATGFRSSTEREIYGGWEHPGGVTRVDNLEREGSHRLVVEPRKGSGLAMTQLPVEVDFDAPPSPTVLVPEAAERTVRVQDSTGRRLEGSLVELIDAGGQQIDVDTTVTDFHGNRISSAEKGLLLGSGTTDAAGEVVLNAPLGVAVAVRCTGEHPPVVVGNAVFADDALVVTVEAGATLRIRFEPADVLDSWRDEAARISAAGHEDPSGLGLYAALRRADGDSNQVFPSDSGFGEGGVSIEPAGFAELRGVPAGTWRVRCRLCLQRGDGGAYQHLFVESPQTVVLRDGATTECRFDLSAYRTGTLVGRVLSEGQPLAGAVGVARRVMDVLGPDGEPRIEQYSIRTDESGGFRQTLPVGRYSFSASVKLPEEGPMGSFIGVRAEPDPEIRAGEDAVVEFSVALAHADVQVLGADGEPVSGLQLLPVLGFLAPDRPAQPLATDDDGRTAVFGTAGSYLFRCRIRSLMDQEAYRTYASALREQLGGSYTPELRARLDATLIELDQPITLAVGGGPEIVLRLPAAWDR